MFFLEYVFSDPAGSAHVSCDLAPHRLRETERERERDMFIYIYMSIYLYIIHICIFSNIFWLLNSPSILAYGPVSPISVFPKL